MDKEDVKKVVRERYGQIAAAEDQGGKKALRSCCAPPAGTRETLPPASCCGGASSPPCGPVCAPGGEVPPGADMGLGCGNPIAAAGLQPGETVVDLGSGGGADCFRAARQVGPTGRVIGVDMTPEMLAKARRLAAAENLSNLEFRLGEIEHLPVGDGQADVVVSNCVVNLAPEKIRVFQEAWRVLKPGGRLVIADILALAPLPDTVRNDPQLVASCIGGAATIDETRSLLHQAGFTAVRIETPQGPDGNPTPWMPGSDVGERVVSAIVRALKTA